MQNNKDKLDMPGGFKDKPSNEPSHQSSTSTTTYQDNLTPTATTMRSANVVNPHGSAYEVAGPFTGGISSVHNRTLDAVKGQSLDSPLSGSGGTPAHSLTEKDCAAAAVMSAAAAGAYDLDSQHNTNLHPISNINNTSASPTVSSPMTPSSITTGSSGSPSLKPLGPHDRPPIKVGIHAHKPSDKATYGNLDSPGAQIHPGPLSDRALAGTPPPTSTPKKTIADPFGPVMVANWNDHKRQTDVSTPTSEDFENPRLHGSPGQSSPAPGSAPLSATAAAATATAATAAAATAAAAKRMHAPSPLRDEVPPVKKADAAHARTPSPTGYFPHVQHSSSMDATTTPHHGSTMTDDIPHQQHKEPLTDHIKEVFSHHEHDTTKPKTAAATAAVATAAAVPLPKETLGERLKEMLHLESHPTVELPIKVNTSTIATSSAAPEMFINRTEYVPVENLKDIDLSKVAQAASHMTIRPTATETTTPTTTATKPAVVKMEPLGERIKEAFDHETHPKTTATTTAIPKEPLGERIKDVFYHEPRPTVEVPIKVNTATIATSSAAPEIFTDKSELVPIENLKDVDISKIALAASHMPGKTNTTEKTTTTTNTATTKDKPIKASTATTGAPAGAPIIEKESLDDRVKDVFHRGPSNTTASTVHSKSAVPAAVTAATVGTAAGVAAFLNDKEADNTTISPHTHDRRAYLAPGTKSSITPTAASEPLVFQPVDASPLKKQTQVPAPVFDTTYMNTPTQAHVPVTTSSSTTTAPVVHHPVRPTEHTEYTIGPPVTATKAAVAAAAVAPIIPIVATTSSTAKPSTSEIHFTDPKTLRPLTGARTMDVPPSADHRSMTSKLMDAATLHTTSEYGPADPKDLHLSDPKALHLTDRIPIAPAVAAAAAAAAAPIVHKSTTTATTTAKDAPIIATTTSTKPSTSEIQFTDPKTLRPLTGTRTMDVPPSADHRSMTTKLKDAATLHTASEYGPADPKDLHLSDPKSLRLTDHVPVVPAKAAATAAAVAAPAIVADHKIAAGIPETYQGPIPQLKPGEEIVWVKTVTTTDYYDDNSPPGLGAGAPVNAAYSANHGNSNMSAPVGAGGYGAPGIQGQGQGQGQGVPINTMHDNTTGQKRHSGFFDRLIHRHHDNVDKGKQRT